LVHVKKTYWTIASISAHGNELTYQHELEIWIAFSMELEGFGTLTLSDPKGNIIMASKFALGKNYGKRSCKQGLTGLGYRITCPNGMNVEHVIGHIMQILGMEISVK
jgi:hypothetical protein